MKRYRKVGILLAVLVVVCVAAFAATRYQQRQEEIRNSGEVILALPADSIQSVSWKYEDTSLAFHRGDTWLYDGDEAFPVDEEKMVELLSDFSSLGAAFIIENVEDFGQYGLDDPVCTISLTTVEQSYEIQLGDFSKMDEQRYLSIGDGNVYLVTADPLEHFDASLSDLIRHDEIPTLGEASAIQFQGTEDYQIDRVEDSPNTYCAEDVYFTERDGRIRPLDTGRVENYLSAISSLTLTDYVTYNATADELVSYGLDTPELTVTVDYGREGEDGTTAPDSFVLHIGCDPEEKAAAQEAEASGEDEIPTVTAYARVGESQIVYRLTSADYERVAAASYDDLRHREVFTADFADVTQIDISLEGETYALAYNAEDEKWSYGDEDVDGTDFQTALAALSADSFTREEATGQEEIGLTIHLNNDNFPTVEIRLYRYDGSNCLAVVDDESVSLVPRTEVVELIEAVHAIVLN